MKNIYKLSLLLLLSLSLTLSQAKDKQKNKPYAASQPTQAEIDAAANQALSQGRIVEIAGGQLNVSEALKQVTQLPVTFRLTQSGVNYDITVMAMTVKANASYLTVGCKFSIPNSEEKTVLYFGGNDIKVSAKSGFNADIKILESSLQAIANVDEEVKQAVNSSTFAEFAMPTFDKTLWMGLGKETAMSFSCGVFKKMRLDGYLKTSNIYLERENPLGKASDRPFFMYFDADNVLDWHDLYFTATASQGFHSVGYKDMGVHFSTPNSKISVDLSTLRNPNHLPACTGSTSKTWKGIAFESFDVRLPSFLRTKANPDIPAMATGSNLFLSAKGLSGTVTVNEAFAVSEGITGGDCSFNMSLDVFSTVFDCGKFQQASMQGNLRLPISNENEALPYTITYIATDKKYRANLWSSSDLSRINTQKARPEHDDADRK